MLNTAGKNLFSGGRENGGRGHPSGCGSLVGAVFQDSGRWFKVQPKQADETLAEGLLRPTVGHGGMGCGRIRVHLDNKEPKSRMLMYL